jgi:hypothetical protein
VKLIDEPYTVCGNKLCLDLQQAKRLEQNKVKVGKWMDRAQNIILYYRRDLSQH